MITTDLFDEIRDRIGHRETIGLGVVTALQIRRYARAVGEDNPLYHDPEYARKRGFADVIAPPNMVPSIVDWGEGDVEEELLTDGTAPGHLLGLDISDVRIMGGGEEMEFHRPVTAGTRLTLHSELVDVAQRQAKTGLMIVLSFRNNYRDEAGIPLLTCNRTVLLR
ncbi:MAG: hypothetical protein GEV03_06100 [Streptosporangiales bacterium]|nr:hypothetical protein [Streptosporangiales bacterium]